MLLVVCVVVRKDSFITHRAFCDALAEESARFSSPVASANLNFRNELMNSLQTSGNHHPQFQGMFRAEMGGGLETSGTGLDLQKPRLPLWLDNANPHHLNNLGNPNSFMAAAAASSTSLPELVQMASQQSQWFTRGQEQATFNNINGSSSSAIPIPRVLKEEEENKGNLSEAISSLYNYSNNNQNQNQNQHETSNNPPPHMSATALLQKAAQMGSTRATNPSVFAAAATAGFGLINSSSSSFANFNLGKPESLNGILHGEMSQAAAAKQSQLTSAIVDAESSLTRDFLGVGGSIENRQFLQENELAKFASIGSAMDMSHYSRNH